jgi:glycerate dehydrogenase
VSWDGLRELGEVALYPRTAKEEVVPRARDAQVLVINKVCLDAAVLQALPSLRYVAVTATGYNCVEVPAALARGVLVSNVPEYGTESVAQFTLALLLELCRAPGHHDTAVRRGRWAEAGDFSFWETPQLGLGGKTIGIVGFGRIGRRVAELAHAFGMTVLAEARHRRDPPTYDGFRWASVDELFTRADVVSLHCPLTPETSGLVNAERLARMKPTALLLNTARGALVVEEDLARALARGSLGGAALDVVSHEPILPTNPLLHAPRCLLTPHMAWSTREARQRLMEETVQNVRAFVAGQPRNLVAQ